MIVPLIAGNEVNHKTRINGVNLVSAVYESDPGNIQSVENINANWVSLCPWAFMTPGDPNIYYNTVDNFWGDRPENMKLIIQEAKNRNLKVLLKPHVWVNGHGWPGDYDLNETGWYFWEKNYASFVLDLAKFAEENEVEMYCIGVEFKTAIQKRKDFWPELIDRVREVYSGELIYAANWDNFRNINFWDKLDYIGIDAYFPLLNEKIPDKEKLKKKWNNQIPGIEKCYSKYQKQVILTEYGYRSTNKTAWRQWEIENTSTDVGVNLEAQVNAYEALYESIWDKEWLAGGFIWKWFTDNDLAGGHQHSGYTPQNKPVEKTIKKWYSK